MKESNGDKNKNLSLDEYLSNIKREEYNNPQNYDAWKIELTIAIKFFSSKDGEKERVMDLNRNNIKFTP